MSTGAPSTAISRNAVALPSPFASPIVALAVPPLRGIPVIEPALVLTESPAGRPLAEYEVAATLPVIWYTNGWPAIPKERSVPVTNGWSRTCAGLLTTATEPELTRAV